MFSYNELIPFSSHIIINSPYMIYYRHGPLLPLYRIIRCKKEIRVLASFLYFFYPLKKKSTEKSFC